MSSIQRKMQSTETNGASNFKLENRDTSNPSETDPLVGEETVKAKASDKTNVHSSQHGISMLTCTLFIVGEMASGGVLALPYAVANSGWSGVILLLLSSLVALYCGILIGKCWIELRARTRIEEPFPRDPYSRIGFECYGRFGRVVVEFCLLVTLIGISTVLLLISAQNIASIIDRKIGSFETPEGETRAWLLIISAFLLPCTYLGTPKDIWAFAVMAAVTTSTACILITIKCILDWPINLGRVLQVEVTVESLFKAFGTISFAYGGTSLFPSFQTDMKKPEKFTSSAALAFMIVVAIYTPTSVLLFLVYGAQNDENALQTIKHQGRTGTEKNIALAAEVLVTFHLIFAFIIILNPVFQQAEEYLKWPNRFGWKRCLLRTLIFLFSLGVAVAVPKFGVILSLIGGTTITMMTYILPCVFYSKLNPSIPLHIKVLHIEIILISIGSGAAVIYSSILELKKAFLSY